MIPSRWRWFEGCFSVAKKHARESTFLLKKKGHLETRNREIRPFFCKILAFKHSCHLGLQRVLLLGVFSLPKKVELFSAILA